MAVHKQQPLTTVVNCRRGLRQEYVGRPSSWGNKNVVGEHGPAEVCVERFERDLRSDPHLMSQVRKRLKGKVLGCPYKHCPEGPCHG